MTATRLLLAAAVALVIAAPFFALGVVCDVVATMRHERRKLVVLRGGRT